MITVTGPLGCQDGVGTIVTVYNGYGNSPSNSNACCDVPQVQLDYPCSRVENIILNEDGSVTCDIETTQEAAILADPKYLIEVL